MSFPGRPPLVPGIPMPTGMPVSYVGIGGPFSGGPPLVPTVGIAMPPHVIAAPPIPLPNPNVRQYRTAMMGNAHNTMTQRNSHQYNRRQQEHAGPPVTVFVGNITERAPDAMVRQILAACGHVMSWKRVQGASGRLQAFGFCEYGSPDAGLRAIRLLHDLQIGDKKLVVKVDAKAKVVLDEYKAEKRKNLRTEEPKVEKPPKEEGEEEEEEEEAADESYVDKDMKEEDRYAKDRIDSVLREHELEMKNYAPPSSKNGNKMNSKEKKTIRVQDKMKIHGHPDIPGVDNTAFDDVEMEEGKRDLITREIGKFREIMKKQEEEKEAERRRKEVRDKERREREKDRDVSSGRGRKEHSVSRSKSRSLSRSVSPEASYSNKIRAKARDRDRRRSRSRSRDDVVVRKNERDMLREKEEEEEVKERKKMDRKAREKEAAYQERLRNWETRERRRAKEYEKERDRERQRQDEQTREARRLKEFLEDYDDERDDPKFYKGRELQRRLIEREKEMEQDRRDRQREREELDELRAKIFAEGHRDPNAEFERLCAEREELYRPKLLVRPDMEPKIVREPKMSREPKPPPLRPPSPEPLSPVLESRPPEPVSAAPSPQIDEDSRPPPSDISSPSPRSPPQLPPMEEDTMMSQVSAISEVSSPVEEKTAFKMGISPTPLASKRKKLNVKEVFNTDDDEDSNIGTTKKRKLVPLDYGEDKKKKDDASKNQEEKRKHIKSLIDKIPTDKAALFSFQIDWSAVDNQLMEKRIRPWINKKIIEYIGEPEPTLVDFICSKVLAGSSPQSILDDVQMVLDEEAEVFVVKMWRLLIYEIEAKKLGLVK